MNVLITSASRKVWLVRAFRRAVVAEGGGLVIAVDASPYAPALRQADKPYLVPWGLDEDFFNSVLEIVDRHQVGLIIPTRDEELPAFARRRADFASAGAHVMVADEEAIRICQDKRAFLNYCLDHGFYVPRVLSASVEDLAFPVFVRVSVGKGSKSSFRASSSRELQYLLHMLPDPIVQEYVVAEEYTVDVFVDQDQRVLSAVPRLRIGVFGGESVVGKTVHHPEIIRETTRLVRSLGLVGFATVQCFWHEEKVLFIEVNPRIGGGASLSIAAGADTPRMALRMAAGKALSPLIGDFKAGLVMLRHSEDLFMDEDDLDGLFDR